MSFTPDIPSTEEALTAILSSPLPELPPQEQHYGSTTVSWWEMDPGEVYIHAEGGSPNDRHYFTTLTAIQLEGHGFKRAQFEIDDPNQDVEHLDSRRYTSRISTFHDWKPGSPGRGLVHPDGSVYTWPEGDNATHMDMSYGLNIPHNFGRNFTISPDGLFRMHDWGPDAEALIPQVRDQTRLTPNPRYYNPSSRVSSWPDIMAKAKRLLMSGQVHLTSNGYQYVTGHVIGDHGEYDSEFSRDDPNSRAITGWQCSCPWDQYAWQRTRKWKKYEGRYCSHIQALIWKSLMTPLDHELTEEQANNLGTGQKLGPQAPAPMPKEQEEALPRHFGPEGDIIQGEQESMNLPPGPEALGGPPGPAQAPLAPPPGNGGNGGQGTPGAPPGGPQPPGVIPPFPGEQMEMQWAGPGTTPGGMESPPGAYSVPGAKPPGQPNNPIQGPGTLSHLSAEFNPPETIRLKKPVMGLAEGPVKGQYGDGEYREVPAGSPGEVYDQDESTGWVQCRFDIERSGPNEPYRVVCFLEPSDIEHTNYRPPSPIIRRK